MPWRAKMPLPTTTTAAAGAATAVDDDDDKKERKTHYNCKTINARKVVLMDTFLIHLLHLGCLSNIVR